MPSLVYPLIVLVIFLYLRNLLYLPNPTGARYLYGEPKFVKEPNPIDVPKLLKPFLPPFP